MSKILSEFTRDDGNYDFYFIANRNDQIFYPILSSILKSYNISTSKILYIDDTVSQIETALYAAELMPKIKLDAPVCFANIDTVVKNRKTFFKKVSHAKHTGAILDTFPGNDPKNSYVHSLDAYLVKEVVDQNIISTSACSGLYGFGSFKQMHDTSTQVLKDEPTANFTYLYNYLINKGVPVEHFLSRDPRDTIVLGTPEEYVINIHRFEQ